MKKVRIFNKTDGRKNVRIYNKTDEKTECWEFGFTIRLIKKVGIQKQKKGERGQKDDKKMRKNCCKRFPISKTEKKIAG